MTWAVNYRQNWIADRLAILGFINRAHLMKNFSISAQQASIDLNRFLREHPGVMAYDKTAKRYVRITESR